MNSLIKISLISIFLLLVACGTVTPKTNIQQELVPIPYVPAPPATQKPTLETKNLSDEDKKDIGKVVRAFGVDFVQMNQYISVLETIINKYEELSKNNVMVDVNSLDKKTKDWSMVKDVQDYFKDINKGK